MSTEILLFNYQGINVRFVRDEAGNPEVVASDLAVALGYRMASDLTRSLDDDEKGTRLVRTPGGDQEMTIITESGMYRAIMQRQIGRMIDEGRKVAVKSFQRWVTHEVLPSIRKRGGYLTAEATEKVLTDPDFIIQLATTLKEERAKTAALETKAAQDAPKVLFADAVAASHTDILVGDLAKLLQQNGIPVGATRLFAWLRKNGYLIKQRGISWNMPTQKSQEMGLFRVKETAVTHSDGHVSINKTPKVTGKGQTYFVSRFLDGRLSLNGNEAA